MSRKGDTGTGDQSANVSWLKAEMHAAGVRPSKSLGQSFLVVDWVAEEIVGHLDVQDGERVVEIGPGFGALTRFLMKKREDTDLELTLVEKDRRIAGFLKKRFPDAKLIVGDVLDLDLSGFEKLISNLPYSISSPITGKLLDLSFTKAVFMYQEEFAERITAGKGEKNYSRLGVKARFRMDIQGLGIFPPTVFYPRPRVSSALLAFTPCREPPFAVQDEEFFFLVVDLLFGHRRKTIRNCLRQGKQKIVQYLDISPGEFDGMLTGLPSLHQRVEELGPGEIAGLADALMGAR